jgi:hypothetical protein
MDIVWILNLNSCQSAWVYNREREFLRLQVFIYALQWFHDNSPTYHFTCTNFTYVRLTSIISFLI